MHKKPIGRWLCGLTASIVLIFSAVHSSAQQTTAFTYQGQLRDGGTNANGVYTMIFALYDSVSGGNRIGSAITTSATLVNGLFTVNLDFGAGAFDGNARWLDITVSIGSDSQELAPRVQVLPSPYAIHANSATSLDSGTWNAGVVNYQGITNVFGVFVDGSLAMGMTTNVVYVPNQLEVASNLNVDGSLSIGGSSFDSNGNLGMQGNLSFFGSDQSINFDGTGSSIAGNNVGAAGIQINTAGNGVAIDGNFAATGSEKLTILRGSVNPDGSVSGGTNFSVTYIPPGTGGVNFLFPVTCQNGANSFTVANDASSSFPTGLWMKLGAGFYQVTGVNINPLEGGGVTSTIQFLPVFSGSSGSYQPVRNMTLYPTYTVSFTNVFSVPPTVLISGSGAWPTQQVVYPNFLITAWSAFLDYSQPITSTNFGVMVDDVGAYPGPGPGIGFSFVAIGPR